MESIGAILRTERENRGLSLEDAHENTKITIQNISALEEDRFDSFPNKVYARAFLRDYANFLGLDSAELLTQYEEQWSAAASQEVAPAVESGSFWRALGYTLLVLVVLAAVGIGGYCGWKELQRERKDHPERRVADSRSVKPEGAVIPRAPRVAPPKPETPKKPAVTPEPTDPAAAPDTQALKLEVTALLPVWTEVEVDGQKALFRTMAKNEKLTFEGKKSIYIKAAMAGAVQLKLNDQLQPPLGSLKVIGKKTFTVPAAPPSQPSATPVTPAAPAPGQ